MERSGWEKHVIVIFKVVINHLFQNVLCSTSAHTRHGFCKTSYSRIVDIVQLLRCSIYPVEYRLPVLGHAGIGESKNKQKHNSHCTCNITVATAMFFLLFGYTLTLIFLYFQHLTNGVGLAVCSRLRLLRLRLCGTFERRWRWCFIAIGTFLQNVLKLINLTCRCPLWHSLTPNWGFGGDTLLL